jgi:hypothetical protein
LNLTGSPCPEPITTRSTYHTAPLVIPVIFKVVDVVLVKSFAFKRIPRPYKVFSRPTPSFGIWLALNIII